MRKFRKVIFPLSVGLIFCIVLSNFNLPVLAYEKSGFNGVDFEQIRARSKSDNNGTTFDKIDSPSKEIKSLSTDSSIITKENIGLEKFKQTETKKKDYVEGEILVKYKNDKINLDTFAGRASALNFVRSKSLEKKEDLRKNNISVLKIKDNKTVEEKITELKNDPNVEYVEPNYIHPWTSMPNDTSFSELWGLHNIGQTVNGDSGADDKDINAPEAWDIFTGSDSILVGVLDSGIAYNHPDLIDNMWDGSLGCKNEDNISTVCPNHGWDYTNNDDNPLDDNGHGTHVAGTIGAEGNNGIGVVGVNWNVKIVALKVGNYAGAITGDVVKAIDFAINNNVKIINASFGGPSFSTSQYEAIERFKAFGGIFIAAAGNDGINNEGTPFYPSDYDLDNIISVAATDQNDEIADFSNYGATSVDVGAPGVNIYSTVADSIVLNETFEEITVPNVPSEWIKDGTNNKWETYALDDGAFWGKVLYGHVPSWPYDNNADTTITSSTYNLGGNISRANIDFWTKCDTEYNVDYWTDYITLEFSSDGGSNFTEVLKWDEYYLDSDTDPSGGALYHFENLNIPSQYLTNNFKLRFRWKTDISDNYYDGCLVDDIKITKYTDGSDEIYSYKNGTSMAAPHVAGLAGLIWGYKPDLTYSEVKNTILSTGDELTSLAGKTTTGKRINAFNALNSLTGLTISGTVLYYDGAKAVPSAIVILEDGVGTQITTTTTDESGFYQFTEVTSGNDYVVKIEKDDNSAVNGVSVSDLIKIRRHIVELETFDQLFKIIAADVNNSSAVSVADLIKIRRYIVEIESPPIAWKFYSTDIFITVNNYLTEGLTRIYTNLTSDMTNQDFTGVKLGDVNNTWINN